MVLLYTFLAVELLLVMCIAMYIDGRRETPSLWIRSDILLGIAANGAVTLLIFAIASFVVIVMGWWQEGFSIPNPWAILASVVVTLWALKRLSVRMRLVNVAALARAAAAAIPKAPELVIPPVVTPGTGATAG